MSSESEEDEDTSEESPLDVFTGQTPGFNSNLSGLMMMTLRVKLMPLTDSSRRFQQLTLGRVSNDR
jgi:hypothetical protein